MRILVTGAGGLVGRVIIPELQAGHEVVPFDNRTLPGMPGAILGDVLDLDGLVAASVGMDVIIHLAIAVPKVVHPHETDSDKKFDVNVKGTYHALQAAHVNKVSRFVYASSLAVVMGYPDDVFVGADTPARPSDIYGVTKYMGEVLCEHYARERGLSVVCLRLGTPIMARDPASTFNPTFVSFWDVAHAFRLAVEAPATHFEVFHIVAESSRRRWDIANANTGLGFHPRDVLEMAEERRPT